MVNIFRPVSDNTILPERILQGKPWRNISFGKNATIQDYKNNGLYLEVGEKPATDQYSKVVLITEIISHTRKEIDLTWEVQSLPQEQIDEMIRVEEIETAVNSGGLRNITLQAAKDIITGKYDEVKALPISGASTAETISNIEAKIDKLIDICEWIDKKEVTYLLK